MAYVVKDMDTIQDILDQFDMELEELLYYNNLEDIMLKPGTTINVTMNGMNRNMNGTMNQNMNRQ
jgi:LysM repeat protein